MNRLFALFVLITNFLKDVVVSGWTTAFIILFRVRSLRPGLVRMSYGDLPPGAANFLSALITLTPGTTTVDIDHEHGEFMLHLLDLEQADATLGSIEREFIAPIRILLGVKT